MRYVILERAYYLSASVHPSLKLVVRLYEGAVYYIRRLFSVRIRVLVLVGYILVVFLIGSSSVVLYYVRQAVVT